jgi:hypothetical protein
LLRAVARLETTGNDLSRTTPFVQRGAVASGNDVVVVVNDANNDPGTAIIDPVAASFSFSIM